MSDRVFFELTLINLKAGQLPINEINLKNEAYNTDFPDILIPTLGM